jgi:meso-butanediol dehydrogenase/(S,S)-butanediol dehydrogenase/diacetyl reductase
MAQRLAGKRALVTGAASGIGAAVARLFCEEGAQVLLFDMDGEGLARVAEEIERRHGPARAATVCGDAGLEADAQNAVQTCITQFGGLEVLVNNAAMRNYSRMAAATPQEWSAMLQVNLVGVATFSRLALPALRESGRGAIVNVSSCYALTGRSGMGIYDATKAAQLGLTRTLAHEEAQHGVRANVVCPGSTLTDFHVRRAGDAGKSVEQLRGERSQTSLLKRWADPREIACPILWLASDEASFITGSVLAVDGGLTAM